jgi:hypothetical protein
MHVWGIGHTKTTAERKTVKKAASIPGRSPRTSCHRIESAPLAWFAPVGSGTWLLLEPDDEPAPAACFEPPPEPAAADGAISLDADEPVEAVLTSEPELEALEGGGELLTRMPEAGVTVPSSPSALLYAD